MKSYLPTQVPDDPALMPGFLRQELLSIQRAANRPDNFVGLAYLAVEPSRPQDGIYLFAAGVVGVTRGAYRYDSSDQTYTFLA